MLYSFEFGSQILLHTRCHFRPDAIHTYCIDASHGLGSRSRLSTPRLIFERCFGLNVARYKWMYPTTVPPCTLQVKFRGARDLQIILRKYQFLLHAACRTAEHGVRSMLTSGHITSSGRILCIPFREISCLSCAKFYINWYQNSLLCPTVLVGLLFRDSERSTINHGGVNMSPVYIMRSAWTPWMRRFSILPSPSKQESNTPCVCRLLYLFSVAHFYVGEGFAFHRLSQSWNPGFNAAKHGVML